MTENATLIDFKRERELGDILGDTFKFIRYNYKPLLKIIFRLTGPILLIVLVALIAYTYFTTEMASPFSIFENKGFETTFGVVSILGSLFLAAISLFYYASLYASLNFAVNSYIEHQGTIIFEEVAESVRQTRGKFLGLAFLSGLIIFVGTLFCFIPGIYLYVPMTLVFSIMAFHRLSVGQSISYSFKLIKHNWWMSFFTLFVMGIVYYLISGVFQLPTVIYSLVKVFTSSGEITPGTDFFDIFYFSFAVIGGVARYLLYGIMVICAVFIFFNLNERKNQTGALETIENLGRNEH